MVSITDEKLYDLEDRKPNDAILHTCSMMNNEINLGDLKRIHAIWDITLKKSIG